jgi:hypothetical protein
MLRLFLKQIDTEPIWFDHDLPDASVDKIAIAAFLMLCIAFAQDLEDRLLDLGRRHAGDGAGFLLPTLQQRLRDVIAIPNALLVGMAWTHRIAAIVHQEACQSRWRWRTAQLSLDGAIGELGLYRLEQVPIDDRCMLAFVGLAAIDDLADIEAVLEEVGERANPVSLGRDGRSVGENARLGFEPFAIQRGCEFAN